MRTDKQVEGGAYLLPTATTSGPGLRRRQERRTQELLHTPSNQAGSIHSLSSLPLLMESQTRAFEALMESCKASIHLTGPWRQVCGVLGQGGSGGGPKSAKKNAGGTAEED